MNKSFIVVGVFNMSESKKTVIDIVVEQIMDRALTEKKMSPVILERTIAKLERHADIVEEFKLWIETKEYKTDTPLQIEGYTAEDIFKIAPFLDGLGVFNFLVTLREQPEKAKAQIFAGFPRK